jgi:hypothetical protein
LAALKAERASLAAQGRSAARPSLPAAAAQAAGCWLLASCGRRRCLALCGLYAHELFRAGRVIAPGLFPT